MTNEIQLVLKFEEFNEFLRNFLPDINAFDIGCIRDLFVKLHFPQEDFQITLVENKPVHNKLETLSNDCRC